MTLHLVLLPLMLAVSLASAEQCASSVGSRMDLSVHGHKNASGNWIITVDTRRLISTEKQWELTMKVHQERRSCDSNEIEQLVSVTSVHPPSHDSPMSGAVEMTTTRTSTTTTPKSCPDGYQVFPGFNCYKVYPGKEKNWTDAREECRRNGGDLMVMETEREREEVYIPLHERVRLSYYPRMGVYIPEGEDSWMTVKGEPALSTWWTPGEPEKNPAYKCAWANRQGLLGNYNCADHRPFICEIPI